MKLAWVYGIVVIALLFSCAKEPSTVCDQVDPDQLCMDYKTSNIKLQTWNKSGNYFILHISNNQDGNPYIPQIDIYFRLYDHVGDTVPQQGTYKAVSYINTGLNTKQFDLDFYLDGEEDYVLDLSATSSFEIESISDLVLDGKANCNFKHEIHTSDKKQVHVNFQGAIFQ
jgi:hypothetical protein